MSDPDSLPPVPPPGAPPADCEACGVAGRLDFEFGCRIDEIAWVTHGREISSLSDFPIIVTCGSCGHRREAVGHAFTIDGGAFVITQGHIRTDDE